MGVGVNKAGRKEIVVKAKKAADAGRSLRKYSWHCQPREDTAPLDSEGEVLRGRQECQPVHNDKNSEVILTGWCPIGSCPSSCVSSAMTFSESFSLIE